MSEQSTTALRNTGLQAYRRRGSNVSSQSQSCVTAGSAPSGRGREKQRPCYPIPHLCRLVFHPALFSRSSFPGAHVSCFSNLACPPPLGPFQLPNHPSGTEGNCQLLVSILTQVGFWIKDSVINVSLNTTFGWACKGFSFHSFTEEKKQPISMVPLKEKEKRISWVLDTLHINGLPC